MRWGACPAERTPPCICIVKSQKKLKKNVKKKQRITQPQLIKNGRKMNMKSELQLKFAAA